MVKVSIEVRDGSTRFGVRVQSESIRQATTIVAKRFPSSDLRVKFPIEPEGFFVEDSEAKAGIVGFERPQEMAV